MFRPIHRRANREKPSEPAPTELHPVSWETLVARTAELLLKMGSGVASTAPSAVEARSNSCSSCACFIATRRKSNLEVLVTSTEAPAANELAIVHGYPPDATF